MYQTKRTRFKRKILGLKGLQCYCPFLETAGTVARNYARGSLGSNDGTYSNMTLGNPGAKGRKVSFNGTNSSIVFTGFSFPTTKFSVGVIVARDGTQDVNDRYLDWQDGGPSDGFTWVAVPATNEVSLRMNNGGSQQASISSGVTNDLEEYLVIATYEVNSVKFYVNGAEVGSDSSVTMTGADAVFTLGKRAGGSNFFKGNMAHFFVTNDVLAVTEVLELARVGDLV